MKKPSNAFSFILLCGLILTACSSGNQPAEAPAEAPNATEAPADISDATEAPATEAAATEPVAAQPETGSGIQHTLIPSSPSASGGEKWGDHSTLSSLNAARALLGDRFTNGRFERPYNANTMDVYFPHLDIDRAVVYPEDATWVYAVITMVGRDANNSFTGQYAIELDLDRNGFGEFLIMADNPSSTDWTTQGVRVYQDANGDIGGVDPVLSDSTGASSDGYEALLFDQGAGDDADLAWVRLDPADPNSFQIAYKQSLLTGQDKYTAGLWAGTQLDPALFDYNDHFTHEQAGAGDASLANFYPIKGLAEFDNTCRQAIGYDATGLEPGICAVQ
jgi:hypothetical protein